MFETKTTSWKHTEPCTRHCFLSTFRDSRRTKAFHSFVHNLKPVIYCHFKTGCFKLHKRAQVGPCLIKQKQSNFTIKCKSFQICCEKHYTNKCERKKMFLRYLECWREVDTVNLKQSYHFITFKFSKIIVIHWRIYALEILVILYNAKYPNFHCFRNTKLT